MRTIANKHHNELLSGHKCWCVLIVRRDGKRHGYTSHNKALSIGNDTFLPYGGITPSQFRTDLKTEVASSQVLGVYGEITETDILSAQLDGAETTLFITSWRNPPNAVNTNTCLILTVGTLGKATLTDRQWEMEILSLEEKLSQNRRDRTQPTCRATLGDDRCQVVLGSYQWRGEVTGVVQNRELSTMVIGQSVFAKPGQDNFYNNGRIEFTTGAARGERAKILSHAQSQMNLLTRPFNRIAVGDRFIVTVGCDKSLDECRVKFNNTDNFRGEPFVPGPNALLRSP